MSPQRRRGHRDKGRIRFGSGLFSVPLRLCGDTNRLLLSESPRFPYANICSEAAVAIHNSIHRDSGRGLVFNFDHLALFG
jgi:hypothetical protein